MSDDLYQQAIIALARRSREQPRLEHADLTATVDNPLCGDRITLDLVLDGEVITRVGHKTRGCLLCEASAGLIADHAPGQTVTSVRASADVLTKTFRDEEASLDALWPELATLAPARRYKSRLDCVTLPFQALIKALGNPQAGSQKTS